MKGFALLCFGILTCTDPASHVVEVWAGCGNSDRAQPGRGPSLLSDLNRRRYGSHPRNDSFQNCTAVIAERVHFIDAQEADLAYQADVILPTAMSDR